MEKHHLKIHLKFIGIIAVMISLAGCVAITPVDPNAYDPCKCDPTRKFDGSYGDVWKATLQAAEELDWNIKGSDEATGSIRFETSYVYSSSFDVFSRVYDEPTNLQLADSKTLPYVRKIACFEKLTPPPAPPNSLMVKEGLKLNVKGIEGDQTEVKARYKIMPYYDYKIGYLGTVPSKCELEEGLLDRTQEILDSQKPVPPPPAPGILEIEYGLTDIFFDFNKSFIRLDAQPVLAENARILKENPDVTVVIYGYADIRGTDDYNIALGQRRANATKAYLVHLGIDPAMLIAISKGETTIFAPGSTEEAFQLNRRSHFIPVNPGGDQQ